MEGRKHIIFFLRMKWFLIWTNLNQLHSRVLCAKFGWNWPSCLRGGHFQILSTCFSQCRNYLTLVKGLAFSFEQTWFPFTQRCFVLSWVEIGPVVLEKRRTFLNFVNVFSQCRNYLTLVKSLAFSFKQTWFPFTQRCFVSSWVEIGPVVLEKKTFRFRHGNFAISYLLSEKGIAFHLNKLELPIPKDALCKDFRWDLHSGSREEAF